MMPNRLRRVSWWVGVGIVVAVLHGTPAWAEEPAEKPFEEPGIPYLERKPPYIQWIAGGLLAAACLFAAFKNPHRSHLD
jgi:hypothetical protein